MENFQKKFIPLLQERNLKSYKKIQLLFFKISKISFKSKLLKHPLNFPILITITAYPAQSKRGIIAQLRVNQEELTPTLKKLTSLMKCSKDET